MGDQLGPKSAPLGADVQFNPAVFAFALVTAAVTSIIFGLAPALRATRVDLQTDLKEGGPIRGIAHASQRFRSALVISETALALVLLVGASLLMQTFINLENTASGMATHNVLTMHLAVASRQPDSAAATRLFRPVLERVRAIPGVRAAGMIDLVPLQQSHDISPLTIEGRPTDNPGDVPFAENRLVSPGYFEALEIPLVAGRVLSEHDADKSAPVVLINQTLAKKYFPNSDPIGHRIRTADGRWAPIVGVVGDIRESRLDQPSSPTLYFSYQQWPPSQMALVVRTNVAAASITDAVRAAIHSIDPNQPVYDVETMDQIAATSISDHRSSLSLLALLATIALALAAAGVYGVMSYSVTQRTREIGIRMALGAEQGGVMRMVVRSGMALTGAGLAIGVVVALALGRVMASSLYGVGATDAMTFAGVVLSLGLVAFVASYVPARRAAAVDPVMALRGE